MVSPGPQASTLAEFNAASAEAAERDVLACCESRAFARAIAGGRPYPDPDALRAEVNAVFGTLRWDDIAEAINAHPRIGDRVRSGDWSAAEQSGAASATGTVQQALADGNVAYEQRFGHVFLICASGLSGQQMLDQLRARLGHDPEAERAVVRAELLKITQLRLAKLLGLLPHGTPVVEHGDLRTANLDAAARDVRAAAVPAGKRLTAVIQKATKIMPWGLRTAPRTDTGVIWPVYMFRWPR
jgi:2-oxo-4-hydroxy-4-carboxy-5-ureidoimidazoline decarboxylase